jgi:glycosyltransferase involved in cell wall biosynthesis
MSLHGGRGTVKGHVPTVSVIIPTYNRRRCLQDALESVFAQTYRDYEVVVVDDGSTDGTDVVVAGLRDRLRFRYIRQENTGEAGARNRGLEAARGSLIAFLDSDDVWLPDLLERESSILAADSSVALVCARSMTAGRLSRKVISREDVLVGDLFARLFQKNFVNNSTVVARKSCLAEAGGFNEAYPTFYDYDLWLKVSRKHALAYVNRCLARCGRQGDNLSKDQLRPRDALLDILAMNYDPARIAPSIYRRRVADCCLSVGRTCLARGEQSSAWRYFFRAWRLQPYRLRPNRYLVKGLFWSCAPNLRS